MSAKIFISYSHIDKDWVDVMHERLSSRLAELLGEQPRIWRDLSLKQNEAFANVLVLELSDTSFLVSVLSPGYVKSEWCIKELNEFCRNAAKNGGLRIHNKSRIFKVIKSPIDDLIDDSTCPPILRELFHELGYKFYETDRLSGKIREFRPELGQDSLLKFLSTLEDLIVDIRDFIKRQQTPDLDKEPAKCIYLAETTPDLLEERNELKRNLQLHNYRVLPDESLPFDDSAFASRVETYLSDSLLSIHLIGADYTTVPVDENLRAKLTLQHQIGAERVRRQHEIAMTRGESDAAFSRVIWMPERLKAQDQEYQRFINYLQNDPGVYEGAEVLCGTKLEDLKTIIQERLRAGIEPSNQKRVYVICDRQDMNAVAPLQSYLNGLNYKVTLPFGAGSQVVSGHKENLRVCDGVMIFYGSVDTMEWKLKDLRRIDGFREKKPVLAKGIYVAGPETEQKKLFTSADALVMKNFGQFTPASIQPFLHEMETSSIRFSAKGAFV
jgi:hypothetical protein